MNLLGTHFTLQPCWFQWRSMGYVKPNRTLKTLVLVVCMGLASVALSAGTEKKNQVKDLHYGEVLFYFYQQDYFTAITKLLASRHLGRMLNHQIDSELLLGGMDLSYGLHQEAGRIFQRLLGENTDEKVRNRAWYYLGKISYQRGYLDRAEDYLRRITGRVQKQVKGDQQLLLAQVLMAKGRYSEAAGVLQPWEGPESWELYGQFNRGIALIRSGQRDQGVRLLDRVGSVDPQNRDHDALKDKANLALGYKLIEDGKPDKARIHLERVRLQGPYSNMALLGAGWADTELNRHQQALVPWSELHAREVIDVSVQEAMLAVPFAYGQLDAHGRAANLYQNAILSYVSEIKRLDDSISSIRSGRLVSALLEHTSEHTMGWFWTLKDLPDLVETRYLTQLMADHDFQEAMKNFRDLGYLQHNLNYWLENINAFDHMLAERRHRYELHLPRAEQTLSEVNLTELDAGRNALAERLDNIVRNEDSLGLATFEQRKLWRKLERLQKRLDTIQPVQDAQELQAKHRLIEGILIWKLSDQYPARVWANRKQLKQLDAAIEEAEHRRKSLERAVLSVPARFEGFGTRVQELRARIGKLLPEVSSALIALGEHLSELAIVDLERRKRQLGAYVTQARYALAQSYDHASSRQTR